jgi:hypothetical protein
LTQLFLLLRTQLVGRRAKELAFEFGDIGSRLGQQLLLSCQLLLALHQLLMGGRQQLLLLA